MHRDAETTFLIVDTQSVGNADTARQKGYDAGKKVSGIKRHIGVDSQGLPHLIAVTTADVMDRWGALQGLAGHQAALGKVQALWVDGGYRGEAFAQAVHGLLGAQVTVAKRSELHTFTVIPRRWVVERAFACLGKCRRLWKNCEKLIQSSLNMVTLAFLRLLLNRT